MKNYCNLFTFFLLLIFSGCKEKPKPRNVVGQIANKEYQNIKNNLEALHSKLAEPTGSDWLVDHPESGQTFVEYVKLNPIGATNTRTKLYLAQLNEMDSVHLEMLHMTKEYLALFYSCEVELIKIEIDYNSIPDKFIRQNESKEIQVLTDFFLKLKLVENLPKDAFGMIGCTTVDIFPDPQWNYVFGQASLNNRVGVWSMRRLGDPNHYPDMIEKSALRNLKIASHETGHMLSMKHCIYYDCIMNGSAHIAETDNKPVYLCPVCLGKINYNRDLEIQTRFSKLKDFWTKNELSIYHQYYDIVSEISFE